MQLAFSIIWFTEILKIWQEEKLHTKHYMIEHVILLKIQSKVDIKEVLLLWFINLLIRNLHFQINLLLNVVILVLIKMNNWLKNCLNELLENLENVKCIHYLKTIFGVLILRICNSYLNLIKEYAFYYFVLLIFLVNLYSLFL